MIQSLPMYTLASIHFVLSASTTLDGYPPCEVLQDNHYGGLKVLCINLNLTYVPKNLPKETRSLLLKRNNLTSLSNNSFHHVSNLRHLDLSENNIVWFPSHVFNGLDKLESLNLDKNRIAPCDVKFEPTFLLTLRGLLQLSIYRQTQACPVIVLNRPQYRYIGSAFPRSLQELYIDCSNCEFTSEFSLLRNLRLLSFSTETDQGSCIIYKITESMFFYLSQLQTLNISDCQIISISPKALLPLKELKILDISVYVVDGCEFDAFVNATMALTDTKVEIIKFKSLKCIELKKSDFKFLANTSLRELYLESSLYTLVKPDTLTYLPRTLEILSLQRFQYTSSDVFGKLDAYKSLWKLDLSKMMLPAYDMCSTKIIPPSVTTFICNDCRCPYFVGWPTVKDAVIPYIPQKRKLLKFVANRNRFGYIACEYVYLDCDSIEYLDLRDNSLYGVQNESFSRNNSIIYLNLAKNRLAKFLEDQFSDLFRTLSKLEFIDLSDNGIAVLSFDTFIFSSNIRVLNISNNHLQTSNFKLGHLVHLETLDFSDNKLHEIDENTRADLEHLPNATIRLHGNPLVCGCEELDFLRWVKRNPNRVEELSSLSCRLPKGHFATFDHLEEIISDLDRLCKSHVVEISVSVCVVVCIMSVLIGVLGYRNRWKLRYLYHVGRRGYRRRFDNTDAKKNDYHYDAFVSYADEDRRFVIDAMIPELEEKCGLKLCIHHRDFLPGEVIATNIVNAIQNSRKTMIILSPSFLKSTWCEFEYNMARMEGVSRREEIVLVVLYEDVPINLLPKDMAMMLRRNCYIEYNNDLFDNEVFWYNVMESIKIIRPTD